MSKKQNRVAGVEDGVRAKRMDAKEFRASGFLQEVNRKFLHPLGLALEVRIEPDGQERFGGVWDYRNDPEGLLYAEGALKGRESVKMASDIEALRQSKVSFRRLAGCDHDGIQPLPGEKVASGGSPSGIGFPRVDWAAAKG